MVGRCTVIQPRPGRIKAIHVTSDGGKNHDWNSPIGETYHVGRSARIVFQSVPDGSYRHRVPTQRMVRLRLLPGGFDLALTFEPAVAVLLVEGTEDDDVLQDDAVIYAIVSDSEAVERGCESRQSLDSRLDFVKWLNGETGLDFFENEAGDRAREF